MIPLPLTTTLFPSTTLFRSNYPAGLVNTASASGATTCGGAVTAANNGTSVALSGGALPATASCAVTVMTTSATPDTYNNSIAAGAPTTANAGANAGGASAPL